MAASSLPSGGNRLSFIAACAHRPGGRVRLARNPDIAARAVYRSLHLSGARRSGAAGRRTPVSVETDARLRVTSSRRRLDLAAVRDQLADVAQTAYTGDGLDARQAFMTSGSPEEFLDRVTLLESVAGYHNDVVDRVAQAQAAAQEAKASAEQAAAEAQRQVDEVSVHQADLQSEIADFPDSVHRPDCRAAGRGRCRPRRTDSDCAAGNRRGRRQRCCAGGRRHRDGTAGGSVCLGGCRTGCLRLLWAQPVRLRCGRHLAAALEQDTGKHGSGGVAGVSPAGGPRVVLQPGEPHRHLHRRWTDGPRLHVR